MLYVLLILAVLAVGYAAVRQRRQLIVGVLVRADLTGQLDDARDERDLACDETARLLARSDALKARADAAETALSFVSLVSDGMPKAEAARVARAFR